MKKKFPSITAWICKSGIILRMQEIVVQSVWLFNPKRKKGGTPKLDKPWDCPFAIANVLSEIKKNGKSNSNIVHCDKL